MRLGIAAVLAVMGLTAAGGAAAQDAVTGKALFAGRCSACHQLAVAGSGPAAPSLKGVFDRKIAALGDFAYSSTLKARDGRWTAAELDAYLASTVKFAPGGKMFVAVTNPAERASLIAYLKTAK